jgi:hypothetical protein
MQEVNCVIMFLCNIQGLIQRFAAEDIHKFQQPRQIEDYDIISTIITTRRELPVCIQNTKLKNHQDDVTGHILNRQETMNTLADTQETAKIEGY